MVDPELIPVATAAEMREWERRCFASGHIAERVVMEAAGRAAALAIARQFPDGAVVAAVGKGNNGGDAVVALRTLRAGGRDVVALPVGGADVPAALAHGWEIPTAEPSEEAFRAAGVIVDGILGTGATGPPREPTPGVIAAMNASGRPIAALDGPTGVDLTSGAAPGVAVEASLTVTFGVLKRGLLLFPGRRLAGRVLLAEVGLPPVESGTVAAGLITDSWARRYLPRPRPDAHKGEVGLVGVVAGRKGVGGAAIMASMGALRAGCGGVRVCSVEENRAPVQAAVPEAVFIDRESEGRDGALAGTQAIVLGPGIGTDSAGRSLLESVLGAYSGPVVLDADALTLIARDEELLPVELAASCVMTPHPGELGRLLGVETSAILADRFGTATAAAERYGCPVLAKGTPSLVATPDGHVLVGAAGHVGVATGGMGDTLGGIIATLLAARLSTLHATAVGLHFAGRAAEAAGRGQGLLPRDVAEALPGVLFDAWSPMPSDPPFLCELPPV